MSQGYILSFGFIGFFSNIARVKSQTSNFTLIILILTDVFIMVILNFIIIIMSLYKSSNQPLN